MPPDGYETVTLPVEVIDALDDLKLQDESRAAAIQRLIELHPEDLTVSVREAAREGAREALTEAMDHSAGTRANPGSGPR